MAEKHLEFYLLEPDKFIKANEVEEITNPIYFIRDGVPTSDGLLSNEIFGITKEDRGNRFGYIELTEKFMHPFVYKQWCSMDRRIREIVHGTKYFRIGTNGDFIEDEENGETGLNFLIKNIDNIKLKGTSSSKRDVKIEFIYKSIKEKTMFLKQVPVIPAYYRDVNTSKGYIGVGEINQIYNLLIIAVRALRETADYGLSMSNSTRGRIQELILQIYNWFTKGTDDSGAGLARKEGIIKRSVMSKTADYSSRLVLSAPELKVEKVDDLMVNLDYSAVPLASLCANVFPYMIFYLRRLFENEFSGRTEHTVMDKNGNIQYIKIKDPLIQFSDTRIKKELERFMSGYSNRFIPVEIECDDGKIRYMTFKGRKIDAEHINEPGAGPLIGRRVTWCDLIYLAAVESSEGKHVLITRYPLDNAFGQFPTKITVSSTKETEPVFLDNKVYKYYPKIREEDIGSNTSSKFIDTLNICNCYLGAIGGDYEQFAIVVFLESQDSETKTILIAGTPL